MDTFDIQGLRNYLKGDLWEAWENLDTDQRMGIPRPPVEEPAPEDAPRFSLISPDEFTVGEMALIDAISRAAKSAGLHRRTNYVGGTLLHLVGNPRNQQDSRGWADGFEDGPLRRGSASIRDILID